MKVRDSGILGEQMWQGFFDPPAILSKLGFTNVDGGVLSDDLSSRIDEAKWDEITHTFFANPCG